MVDYSVSLFWSQHVCREKICLNFTEHTLPSSVIKISQNPQPEPYFKKNRPPFQTSTPSTALHRFLTVPWKLYTFVTNCDRISFLSNHWGFPVVTVTWAFLVYHLPVLPWRWPLPNGMVPVPYPVSRRSWELQKAPKPPSPQPCNPMGFPTCSIEFFKARLDISRLLTHFLLGNMKLEVETLSGESLVIIKGGFQCIWNKKDSPKPSATT